MTSPAPLKQFDSFSSLANFIWSCADLLRGDYKPHDYGKVILPFTLLRRLDCVLAPTKEKVLTKYETLKGGEVKNLAPVLNRITGVGLHNISKLDFERLKGSPNTIAKDVRAYIKGFSENAREVLERFGFEAQLDKLDEADLLYQLVVKFAEVDLHPERVPNHVMGSAFEELIRRFAEQSNETAGEHFTPREVVKLMVNLLLAEDAELLTRPGVVKTLLDPACGTGGMLSVTEEYLRELNPKARLEVFGQELNDETYAICRADMMMKGQRADAIKRGNSFSEDGHAGERFDYLLANPPFGVEWKKVEKSVRDEHERLGHAGRFGAGLPRISDGSLLFLQHMLSKMKPVDPRTGEGGSRVAIVFNGSPLFTGEAGSGESEIRRWVLENDWLEAIVALPDQLFFNTGISTYVWLLTNRKAPERKGKVQLINAVEFFVKLKKSLGEKRKELSEAQIAELVRLYGDFAEGPHSKILGTEDFGYRRIIVERPLRLSFQASPERLQRLAKEKAFLELGAPQRVKKGSPAAHEAKAQRQQQEDILQALRTLDGTQVWKNRDAFQLALKGVFTTAGIKPSAKVWAVVLAVLGERDETGEVCRDQYAQPEPDVELRDSENVPLKEDITTYFQREVRPHVPDAWIDEAKTKVGYEIPFTRHFFKFQTVRPLPEIEAEILGLEREIQGMLAEVLR
ncbi:SAM-dependent DNA methyltransferase [Aggregicoccus sp. 17bor-14]|uniref:type I restriction-modification system subunit M n=1 Tax=Myxococcaceae TaxID=31 RepID=UPI00129C3641|nr:MULTISPECIES: class I SAM-dependent DNA methyltransferase [Myxococcaceae]MBF5043174.1 SAM-dependent DNA methyltransferase [Simulacricoccus sp. 17bor-14]MRI88932.1 SAM-dependent DNA methyltransferase [Aggregicoccus sp. 17bor-14]